MKVGEVLKQWRLASKINVRDAAKIMGISAATLSRIERGENCDGHTLAKILTWFFGRSNDPHP